MPDYSCKWCGKEIGAGQPDGGMDERLCVRCAASDAHRTTGWRTIESAPSHGDNVWVFGGLYAKPTLRSADGEWWRAMRRQGEHVPTHWAPLEAPPLLPEMEAVRG